MEVAVCLKIEKARKQFSFFAIRPYLESGSTLIESIIDFRFVCAPIFFLCYATVRRYMNLSLCIRSEHLGLLTKCYLIFSRMLLWNYEQHGDIFSCMTFFFSKWRECIKQLKNRYTDMQVIQTNGKYKVRWD